MGIHVIKSTVAPSVAPTILQVGAHWVKTTEPKGQWFAVGSDTVADWIDQSAIAGAVAKTGGTMTGPLKVPQTLPTDADDVVATKKYVDTKAGSGGGGSSAGSTAVYRITNPNTYPYYHGANANTLTARNPWSGNAGGTRVEMAQIFSNFNNFPTFYAPTAEMKSDNSKLVAIGDGIPAAPILGYPGDVYTADGNGLWRDKSVIMIPFVVDVSVDNSELEYVMMRKGAGSDHIEVQVFESDPSTNLPKFYDPVSRLSVRTTDTTPYISSIPNGEILYLPVGKKLTKGSHLYWIGWDIGPNLAVAFHGMLARLQPNPPLGSITNLVWRPRKAGVEVSLFDAMDAPYGQIQDVSLGYQGTKDPTHLKFVGDKLVDDTSDPDSNNWTYDLSGSWWAIGNAGNAINNTGAAASTFIPWVGYTFLE